ncbi:HutD protein [Brevibacterium sanguinis]|uniref:HutD protein n=2 Tax=Brevibacterium TaxID=1696 RepID=A0A366IE46_9MICO|nr:MULTISPECIES: HutD family protein [Brevibacterium]RBP61508.1 HutD protein [Brevibacterium sanguinis]RBP68602.1 HutD protein [Brevibacterium celere]
MRVLTSFADHPPVPWANGGGETTELVSLDDSRQLTPRRPAWRLSVARLESPGPFSSLPGMARTFLPVGAEVVLSIDGDERRVTEDHPVSFDGGQEVRLVDLPTPCFALNLMVAYDSGDRDPAVATDTDGLGPAVAMTLGNPPHGGEREHFAVTLEKTPELPRFQLIHLGADESLPAELRVAFLH